MKLRAKNINVIRIRHGLYVTDKDMKNCLNNLGYLEYKLDHLDPLAKKDSIGRVLSTLIHPKHYLAVLCFPKNSYWLVQCDYLSDYDKLICYFDSPFLLGANFEKDYQHHTGRNFIVLRFNLNYNQTDI